MLTKSAVTINPNLIVVTNKLPILGPPHCASSHTHVCPGSIKYLLQMQVFMFDFCFWLFVQLGRVRIILNPCL